ncbi:Wall-associated receptor kinase [Musa troglodytarum]|uniref:Wall-associated receptor kinase n=1 Tax=Musa troglodytarum TaxID=320322 RepID=A0A9E7J8Y1_9LILI|nr:Wall-associated receptor kinase [Musa troglodytarum]
MASTLPPLAFQLLLLMLRQATTTAAASAPPSPNVLLPRCNDTCGGVSIPYPFGIGDGCFREGFEVTCEVVNGSATPTAFLGGSERNITVKNISLLQGQASILNDISWVCFNSTGGVVDFNISHLDLSGLPFRVSGTRNKFTTLGCNIIGILVDADNGTLGTGCISGCFEEASIESGSCHGTGCCETTIPEKLDNFTVGFGEFVNLSSYTDYSPCSYAFIAEQDWFSFDKSDLRNHNFGDKYKDGVPLVLDWVAGNQTCKEAKRNLYSYACRSTNSTCFDSTSLHGYICNCSTDAAASNDCSSIGTAVAERVVTTLQRDMRRTGGVVDAQISSFNLSGLPFRVSSTKNRLTTMGCNVIGIVVGGDNYSQGTGCASFCFEGASIASGSCSGTGCCQTTVPEELDHVMAGLDYFLNLSSYKDDSPCSYAFIAEQDWFHFNKSDLGNHTFRYKYKDGVPLVLDWVAGNQTCEEAKRNPSYACRSTNSECFNSESLQGYICNCSADSKLRGGLLYRSQLQPSGILKKTWKGSVPVTVQLLERLCLLAFGE